MLESRGGSLQSFNLQLGLNVRDMINLQAPIPAYKDRSHSRQLQRIEQSDRRNEHVVPPFPRSRMYALPLSLAQYETKRHGAAGRG